MKRLTERLVLAAVLVFCLAAASCYASGGYVGYGYGGGYYDDPFYTPPIDRYGYGYGYGGFYGHP